MTATKSLALGVLLVGVVAEAASAGSIVGNSIQWSSWYANSGVVSNLTSPSMTGTGLFASLPTSNSVNLGTTTTWPSSTWAGFNSATEAAAPVATSYAAPVATSYAAPMATSYAAPMVAAAQAAPAQPTYDAYINLGTGPYPNAGNLTTGNAQPWYQSSQVVSLFGGTPTAQQQAEFNATVLQRVEQTFALSGVPVTLTTDPTASAAHTLSVVSNASASSISSAALGLTDVGGNGFDFIDHAAKSAQNLNQLEWLVAHNVSHELMLAFGVGENYDKSGSYIDAPMANWLMMTNPNSTFSLSAAQALIAANMMNNTDSMTGSYAQLVGPQTVPEPATVAIWAVALGGLLVARARRNKSVSRLS